MFVEESLKPRAKEAKGQEVRGCFGVPETDLTNTLKVIGSCAAKRSGPPRHGPLISTWLPLLT
jgi:hypothetical protein